MCIGEDGLPAFLYIGVCGTMCICATNSITGMDTMDVATTWFGIALLLSAYLVVLYFDWTRNLQP
jgi:hypothetical protein